MAAEYVPKYEMDYDNMDDDELFEELAKYEGIEEFEIQFREILCFVENNLQASQEYLDGKEVTRGE